jgi:cell division protein FtsB
MDAVDDLLRTTDPPTARQFIESVLLPALQHFRLLNHVVSVRAQYAVVLAYCGDAVAASAELEALRPIVAALSEHARSEFENQAQLIAAIIREQLPA